jgi:hypothetical protein
LILACSKGKLTTTPTLELKSLNTKVVPINGTLRVDIKVRDKEGDISDTFYVRKIRLNKRTVSTTLRDSFFYSVPEVPSKTFHSEFQIDLDYQTILSALDPHIPGSNPPRNEPDTLMLKFSLKDKARHISDTLVIPQIVVIR